MRFTPQVGEPLTLVPGNIALEYGIASVQYAEENWSLTAEYAREPLKWRRFGPWFPDSRGVGEGWCVQATWRPRDPVELMLSYQEWYANRADRNGALPSARTGGLLPTFDGYTHILSVGLRWDINAHWMLRAEYGRHRGTFDLSLRENPNPGDREEYWDLFAVQAVFRF